MGLDVGDLFERYHGVVYRRCLGLLKDEQDAAEAVQDVFERALKGLGRFRLASSPLTWLYAIATRHCLQQLRNRSTHALKDALFSGLPDSVSPDHAARADLERTLARLSTEELQLCVYAFHDGMTQEEISELLRLSRKTVGRRIRELAARLAIALDAEGTLASAGTTRDPTPRLVQG